MQEYFDRALLALAVAAAIYRPGFEIAAVVAVLGTLIMIRTAHSRDEQTKIQKLEEELHDFAAVQTKALEEIRGRVDSLNLSVRMK